MLYNSNCSFGASNSLFLTDRAFRILVLFKEISLSPVWLRSLTSLLGNGFGGRIFVFHHIELI
jgi:hypothetical protein